MVNQTWWDLQKEADLHELLTVGINGPEDQTRRWIAERVGEDTVLDVGCGTGELAALLLPPARKTSEYFGLDLSLSMVGICRRRFPQWKYHFSRGAVEAMPWPDQSFDWAVCRHVIDHLEDYHAACAELRRVARRVIVVLFNPVGSTGNSFWLGDKGSPRVVTKSHDAGLFAALRAIQTIEIGEQTIIVGG